MADNCHYRRIGFNPVTDCVIYVASDCAGQSARWAKRQIYNGTGGEHQLRKKSVTENGTAKPVSPEVEGRDFSRSDSCAGRAAPTNEGLWLVFGSCYLVARRKSVLAAPKLSL
jgi:hypothetical protein